MNDATQLVHVWKQLLAPFALVLTQPGFNRFTQWVTRTVLGCEEHTITQISPASGSKTSGGSSNTLAVGMLRQADADSPVPVLAGDQPAADAAAHGIRLEMVKLEAAKRGFMFLPRR